MKATAAATSFLLGIFLLQGGCASSPAPEPGSTVLASATEAVPRSTATYDLANPADLPDRLDIPLIRRGGYLLVPASVNDQPVGTMMIDTGASLSVIAQGVAGRIELDKDGQGKTVGVGGIEAFDYYKVRDYTIGQSGAVGETPGRCTEAQVGEDGGSVAAAVRPVAGREHRGHCGIHRPRRRAVLAGRGPSAADGVQPHVVPPAAQRHT